MSFVIANGKVLAKKDAELTDFLWENPFILSQKVWFGFGGIPLLQENIKSLKDQLATFNQPLPELFDKPRELFRLCKRILNKNKFYRSGHLTIQLFISPKKIDTLISSTASTEFDFPFSTKGVLCDFSDYPKNSLFDLGQYGCHNSHLWNSAKAQKIDTIFNGLILTNEKEVLCEGIGSNIFMLKGNTLYTPSLKTGCFKDTLRPIVFEQAKLMSLKVTESAELKKQHLMEMDEVFFASEANGIQWMQGIGNKRFVHQYSDLIHENINIYLKNRCTE